MIHYGASEPVRLETFYYEHQPISVPTIVYRSLVFAVIFWPT